VLLCFRATQAVDTRQAAPSHYAVPAEVIQPDKTTAVLMMRYVATEPL